MVMSADELEALAAKLKAARDAEKRAGELPGVGAERLAKKAENPNQGLAGCFFHNEARHAG